MSIGSPRPFRALRCLGRRWIGIDVTNLAITLIRHRLRHTYGDDIEQTY